MTIQWQAISPIVVGLITFGLMGGDWLLTILQERERSSHYFLSVDKLFDAEVFLKIAKEQKEPEHKSIQLLSEDPRVINELLTRVQYFSVTCLFAANFGLESCKEAEQLIELIKKEYRLE